MKLTIVALLLAGSTVWAQRATSPGGFGRMSNPGGVATTTGGGGFGRMIYPGTGAPAVSRSSPNASIFPATQVPVPRANHATHASAIVVPYPVYYGGGFYDYDPPPAQVAPTGNPYYTPPPDQPQSSPVIIINQYFRPETANPVIHDYTNVPLPEPTPRAETNTNSAQDNQPVMFLIAMKDHTIYPALAYWVEGDTLNYITTQGAKNSASLDLVDREFSKQLNRDRKIDFGLPEK